MARDAAVAARFLARALAKSPELNRMSSSPQTLVHYALRHLCVKTNICSLQKHECGYTLLPRTVPDYNFIHVTRGRVVWVIDGADHPLAPGDLVIVPPDIKHQAYSQTKCVTLGSVHVEATLPGGRNVFEMLQPPRQQKVPFGCFLDIYLRGAARECARIETTGRLRLPQWAQLIVLELFESNAASGLLKCKVADPLISAMLEDLDKRLEQPVTLGELSHRSGFSAQHLNRTFRRALGVTPLQYVTRVRMEQAAALLRDGRLTVQAIGKRFSYTDPYYFSRVFSQHFGCSPAQYRAASDSDSPSPRSAPPFTTHAAKR